MSVSTEAASAPKETEEQPLNNSSENSCSHTEAESEAEAVTVAKSITPWEQHSGMISIPRFDYFAPSSLLHHSHSGFLITCTIKREKSATKEAISILEKHVGAFDRNAHNLDRPGSNTTLKRRKVCIEDSNGEYMDHEESSISALNSEQTNQTCAAPAKEENRDITPNFSLVKLTRSGLLLFIFPKTTSSDPIDIVSDIIQSLEKTILSPPLWCHRFFPIQATCSLNEKELQMVVSKLVKKFINDNQDKLGRPVKFAVGYNRRGIEETELKIQKDHQNGSNSFALLDRNKCFGIVASAVKDSIEDSVVDLKSPELSVLVELLPLSGVLASGSLVVAVSVLPKNLVCTKPRLCIKPLVSNVQKASGVS